MTEVEKRAEAVLKAYGGDWIDQEPSLAAALRAAVEQVLPVNGPASTSVVRDIRAKFFAIADFLEEAKE